MFSPTDKSLPSSTDESIYRPAIGRLRLVSRPSLPPSSESVSSLTPRSTQPSRQPSHVELQHASANDGHSMATLPRPTLVKTHSRDKSKPPPPRVLSGADNLKRTRLYSDADALFARPDEDNIGYHERVLSSGTPRSSISQTVKTARKRSISSYFETPTLQRSSRAHEPSLMVGNKCLERQTASSMRREALRAEPLVPISGPDATMSREHTTRTPSLKASVRQQVTVEEVLDSPVEFGSSDHGPSIQSASESEYVDESDETDNMSDPGSTEACQTVVDENNDDEQDVGDGGLSEIDEAVDFVLRLFAFDDMGCSSQDHANSERDCREVSDEHLHTGLAATYEVKHPMLHTTKDVTAIGLDTKSFPDPKQLGRGRFLRYDRLRKLFEGTKSSTHTPTNICLHGQHQGRVQPGIEYDIDALLVFATGFNGFRPHYKVSMVFIKECRFNISSNLHITIPVPDRDKRGRPIVRQVQIRDVPHLYIGTVELFPQSTVFVIFPRLYGHQAGKKSTSWLTDAQAERFLEVWMAVCREQTSVFIKQGIPPTAECAERRARVRGNEHRSTNFEHLMKDMRYYKFRADDLGTAWAKAQAKFRDSRSGLGMFKDASLFINSKNTKMQDPAPTIHQALQIFRDKMDAVFERDKITYYADLGAKVVPNPTQDAESEALRAVTPDSILSDGIELGEPATGPYAYLWRACCLERLYTRMRVSLFGASAGRKQTYNSGYLRDVTNISIEPPGKSRLRKGGLLYLQAYNSVKEILDAQQIYPFDRPKLVNLALPPDVVGPATLSVDRTALVKSYSYSKDRVRLEFSRWQDTGMGIRLEVRISGDMIDRICERLEAGDQRATISTMGSRTPSFVWCIPTRDWCNFMRGNIHKITSAIEMIILSAPTTGVTLDTSQLLYALFVYLKEFSNTNPARRSLLWQKESSRPGRPGQGFDLKTSIHDYGFGWLAPLVDWQMFQLRRNVVGNLIGCERTIGSGYHEPMQRVQDQWTIFDLLHRHISSSQRHSDRETVGMKTMAHFILRQYRRDFLGFLAQKNELHPDFMTTNNHDQVQFCHSEMTKVLAQAPNYLRAGRLVGSNDATELFDLLMWTNPHKRPRTYFDGAQPKEWRRLVRRAETLFQGSTDRVQTWYNRLRREFERYMFIIPYPDPNGVFTETDRKTGRRNFYAAGYMPGSSGWRCLGPNPRMDRPPDYPKTLWLSYEELDTYLATRADRQEGT